MATHAEKMTALLNRHGPMTAEQIAASVGAKLSIIKAALGNARLQSDCFRITGYTNRIGKGRGAAIYEAGGGEDAPYVKAGLGADLRAAILQRAALPVGFAAADGIDGFSWVDSGSISHYCNTLAANGQLIKSVVTRSNVRFFARQADADAHKSAAKVRASTAPVKQEDRANSARPLIRRLAATPEGFKVADVPLIDRSKAAHACRRMTDVGELHQLQTKGLCNRWFATAELLAAYAKSVMPAPGKKNSARSAGLQDIKPLRNAMPPPKTTQQARPASDAQIVWPANVRHTVRPMGLGRYEVAPDSVPMRRIGEAGFAMTVGGVA